jgi:hypothetical protein
MIVITPWYTILAFFIVKFNGILVISQSYSLWYMIRYVHDPRGLLPFKVYTHGEGLYIFPT